MIAFHGFASEKHCVTTEDGYILTLFRVKAKNSTGCHKDVVIIHNFILASSDDFVEFKCSMGELIVIIKMIIILLNCFSFIKLTSAFSMVEAGYDVWLGNSRGNFYSRRHVCLDPDDLFGTFWDFSWDDIGLKDYPAGIHYIRRCTKQDKVYMIGHSQSASSIIALLSLKPEYNKWMKAVCWMTPVTYLNNSGLFFRLAGQLSTPLKVNVFYCYIYRFSF